MFAGIEAMLVDYFTLMKRRQDSLKLEVAMHSATQYVVYRIR